MNAEPCTADRSLIIERELPHAPAKVWRALTELPLLEQWLMKSDFAPVPGRRFNFRAPPSPHWNGVTDCEVLIVEPVSRLAYRWDSTGAEAGVRTIVTWTLTPTAGGTLLRFEQSGFGPHQNANYEGAKYGWQRFVTGLERVTAAL